MKLDKKRYKVYSWKNFMVLHWMINPALVINELFFGQRVPKISLEDKTIDKPRIERSYIPCPHCETLHDGRTWSTQNGTAFKNWFGLYCPNCKEIIPCVMNIFTLLALMITFPFWGWFRKNLKENWLAKQPARYQNINTEDTPNYFDENSWFYTGLSWGLVMFLLMSLIYPLITKEPITTRSVIVGFIVWAIAGIVYGYAMKLFSSKKGSKSTL